MKDGMTAGPQAGADGAALEALELDYGHAYMLGYDSTRGWWAASRDQVGGYLSEGTPGELRAAIEAARGIKSWCSWCGQQVRDGDAEAGRPPVHTATGRQLGEDNHLAAPADREPELWRAAREITAEFRGAFQLDARFGILRAEWTPAVIGYAVTAMHYTASGRSAGADMRRQLDEAVAGTRWEREMPS